MLSIVIPAYDLADSIVALVDETISILGDITLEIIVVDDASDDGTAERIREHASPQVRLVCHTQPGGAAAAIHSGVMAATYPIVCALDGDARVPPWHIPEFLAALEAGGPTTGLVLGRRRGRAGLGGVLAHMRQAVLRDGTLDPSCGLRVFRRDAYLALPYFDGMQLYLAALFARDGWQSRHLDVDYRGLGPNLPRGWSRPGAVRTAFDMLGVLWLKRRQKRGAPMLRAAGSAGEAVADTKTRRFELRR